MTAFLNSWEALGESGRVSNLETGLALIFRDVPPGPPKFFSGYLSLD